MGRFAVCEVDPACEVEDGGVTKEEGEEGLGLCVGGAGVVVGGAWCDLIWMARMAASSPSFGMLILAVRGKSDEGESQAQ